MLTKSIIDNPPPSPKATAWGFVERLSTPASLMLPAGDVNSAAAESGSFRHQKLRFGTDRFSWDGEGLLDTARDDFARFLRENRLDSSKDGLHVECRLNESLGEEQYVVEVLPDKIEISAGDIEGVRRALYRLKSVLCETGGKLPLAGRYEGKHWLKNRISRCFFGPIKRPPLNRDELADDVDYYPDAYLSRLAAEGVNGLWLTIAWRDLCKTSITDLPPDGEQRLAKLRRTVERCRRYGIGIWVFCIEPLGFEPGDPVLAAHPELGGGQLGPKRFFCPSTELARRYIYESTHWLFSQVPNLAGMINITHGERGTTCLSEIHQTRDAPVNCPRCSQIEKWQIIHRALEPMAQGIRDANRKARLISWLYMSQDGEKGEWVSDVASHLPEGVILQVNFESNGVTTQLNQHRIAGDYWLSYTGPSSDFRLLTSLARNHGNDCSAKLQVACSHELATVPFIPVPGILYRKFRTMHKLGVHHAMLSWYFGNHPGIMNRAVGLLAQESFAGSEDNFLLRLAQQDWGNRYAPTVVEAWKAFADAYRELPVNIQFQYYGPAHNGPAWPLHLRPVMLPLAPNWLAHYPPSGDTIGECLDNFTLPEALHLCERVDAGWQQGIALLEPLRSKFRNNPDRAEDLAVMDALSVLFDSAKNILRFYYLRAKLILGTGVQPQADLATIADILHREIANSRRLKHLCALAPSLGFNSEAEAFKFFPAILDWRVEQLRQVIAEDLPLAERAVADSGMLDFPIPYEGSYKMGSGWCALNGLRWRSDWQQDEIVFHFSCDLNGAENAVVYINLFDKMATSAPMIIHCDPKHKPLRHSWPRIEWKQCDDRIISGSVYLSNLAWDADPSKRPDRISITMHRIGADESSTVHWPQSPIPPLQRLKLGRLNPSAMAHLIWD